MKLILGGATFPKSARLRRPIEFNLAFKGKRLARGALFTLNYANTEQSTRPQLGLVIAKRFAKRAVTRNTLKRIIRETFRQYQDKLPPGYYVVRLYKTSPNCSLTVLKKQSQQEIERILSKSISTKNSSISRC